MNKTDKDLVHLDWLVHSFYRDRDELGEFTSVSVSGTPQVYQQLLAHSQHMTVTVEKHHSSLVDVELLQSRLENPFYLREILLRRQTDHRVVQYGIVRLFLPALEEEVSAEILAGKVPLGRVLIEHNVLREVRLGEIWRITCSPSLARYLESEPGATTYGRTALIYFNDRPALELLEIVAPEPPTGL